MSKELEALEVSKQLKDFVFELELGNVDKLFVGGSFNIIEKELKALEIIKEKLVCLKAIHLNKNVEEYNIFVDLTNSSPYHLTQEQYDLLKEVLL